MLFDKSLINNKLSATDVSCLDATALSKSFSRYKNNSRTSEYKKSPKLVGG